MSRRITQLLVAAIFATVLIGRSAQARSGETSEPARAPKAAAEPTSDRPKVTSIHDLLLTVQRMRDEVRKLRGDVEELRKQLASKPRANPAKPTADSSQIYRVTMTQFGDGDRKIPMLYVMPVAADDPRQSGHDEPAPDEILQSLPDKIKGPFACVSRTERRNVRIDVKKIVDSIGECRFYPLVGNARLKKCHYKCMVYFDKFTRSDWPIPFMNIHPSEEVVYIDHDLLIGCAASDAPDKKPDPR